jgi:hypothetical protein
MSNEVKFTGSNGIIELNQNADKNYVYIDIRK